ncbi:glycosyltransferase family 4 protein [Sphingomonas piscis]|uniref:Glycosyltransferase family 4 protein n=1 Tax=Sphingomonas piscis TaxID=2714943 RepID=A0A6G7YMU9_9SPHN|nr:glycosyltransferase family 1 protein [Sphingomonas piscis]QIK78062.1 glycosyltransferase family 4 protein [Sphingomonas piscis]
MTEGTLLIDVSRLVWRRWTLRLPTGIDRVCFEYVLRFGREAQAVVQFRGKVWVFNKKDSRRLFELICSDDRGVRPSLVSCLALGLLRASTAPPRANMVYLNVGHTGLDHDGLVNWVARHKVKAVYLIHDLIPITHPQYCRAGEADKHALRTRNALISATGIICNSAATCAELRTFAEQSRLPMPDTILAWISGTSPLRSAEPKLLDRPYFITVGTIEARKNHLLLLAVWKSLVAKLGDGAPILVIVGQRGWEADAVTSVLDNPGSLSGFVRECGRCDDDELASWMRGARALLMPSRVEGFGLPVIEALQLQVPVIAADLAVYREIVGTIPSYLDPEDPQAWEQKILEYSADSEDRSRQLRDVETFKAPDWESHFAIVTDWLPRL